MRIIYVAVLTLILAGAVFDLQAQYFNLHNPIRLPDKSQEAMVKQRIGYTDITIIYHSPAVKGREIWGGLVPFGSVWRAGANENTIFTITHDVMIEGKPLPAGTYGLHLLPESDRWTFIFSDNATSWGSYFYNEEEDALRVSVPVEDAPEFREWMSFDFHRRDRGSASVVLSWADKRASIDLTLDIDEIALDHIRKQLRSDAYWEWFSWCQAADYCAEYEVNTEEALEWIDRSIAMEERFENLDVKATLLRQIGETAASEKVIERAVEIGTAVDVDRYGRRFFNRQEYQRSEYLFDQALQKNPDYWRAHFNKGRALEAQKRKEEALKSYQTALEKAPQNMKEAVREKISALR